MPYLFRYIYPYLFFILFANTTFLQAQNPKILSEAAEISILTCSPAEDLYSAFGHSAIRVRDTLQRIDFVYNYGTFNFNMPNFYLNFLKGNLEYQMSKNRFVHFQRNYVEDNRSIFEQVLELTEAEKLHIYHLLEKNYYPKENRLYMYDFFFNNCSTKLRDIVDDALKNKLNYNTKDDDSNLTFRQLLKPYIKERVWADWGINLILGLPTDRKAKHSEYTFLPEELMKAFDMASVTNNGEHQTLVKHFNTIFQAKIATKSTVSAAKNFLVSPALLLSILFVLITAFSFFQYGMGQHAFWLDFLLFFTAGLVGVLLLTMWLFTNHQPTYQNFNLLWAFPPHFFMSFLLLRKNKPYFLKLYFWLGAIVMAMLIFLNALLPQSYHIASVLIMAILVIRAWLISRVA